MNASGQQGTTQQGSVPSQPIAWPAGLSTATAVLFALLVSSAVYRVRLGLSLENAFGSEIPHPLETLVRQLGVDALFSLALAAVTFLVGQLVPLRSRALRIAGNIAAGVSCFLCGVVMVTQHGLFFATGNGLTAQMLREVVELSTWRQGTLLLSPIEQGLLVFPAVLFVVVRWLCTRVSITARWRLSGAQALVCLMLVASGIRRGAPPLPEALSHQPMAFVLLELFHSRPRSESMMGEAHAATSEPGQTASSDVSATSAGDIETVPVGQDGPKLMLDGEAYLKPLAAGEPLPQKHVPAVAGSKRHHVVLIVMESTGTGYALEPVPGAQAKGQVAMPFLRSLADQGLWLRSHFSSGNSSPRGIFSLLSGLYVMPEVSIFDVRKDNHIPSLGTYLPRDYARFLVTPGSLDWYFPHAFMQHSGFHELYGYHSVPVRKNAPGGRSQARDERETVGYFLSELDDKLAKKQPIAAIYYSFVAHWPYPDYGPETHVLSPTRPLHQYYNNLRFLDGQIQRIYQHLQNRGILDDTILVVVGDHGEAFGQHPHNYAHSRMSFNENVRTPALFVNRALFPARTIDTPTSHVDILPTLLDALKLPYNAERMQGESLFQDSLRRKYVFLYGNEDTLSSVSREQVKLQVSLRDGTCWVYDVRHDPEERNRLPCTGFSAQREALLAYRRHQRGALRQLNEYCTTRGCEQFARASGTATNLEAPRDQPRLESQPSAQVAADASNGRLQLAQPALSAPALAGSTGPSGAGRSTQQVQQGARREEPSGHASQRGGNGDAGGVVPGTGLRVANSHADRPSQKPTKRRPKIHKRHLSAG